MTKLHASQVGRKKVEDSDAADNIDQAGSEGE
jgi:hypothetical protein